MKSRITSPIVFSFAAFLLITLFSGIAHSQDKFEIMKGTWEIQTVGKQGKIQKPEAFNGKHTIEFDGKKFHGKPFGWEISTSSLSRAEKGGEVTFTFNYKIQGGNYPLTWKGKLNSEGTEITEGKFTMVPGSGTFTAKKVG